MDISKIWKVNILCKFGIASHLGNMLYAILKDNVTVYFVRHVLIIIIFIMWLFCCPVVLSFSLTTFIYVLYINYEYCFNKTVEYTDAFDLPSIYLKNGTVFLYFDIVLAFSNYRICVSYYIKSNQKLIQQYSQNIKLQTSFFFNIYTNCYCITVSCVMVTI